MVSKANLTVELIGKQVRVHEDMAIFITMNPTYAGRSNLPDNLKKLFRSLAMTAPDMTMIAEVTLFSQGWILKYIVIVGFVMKGADLRNALQVFKTRLLKIAYFFYFNIMDDLQ